MTHESKSTADDPWHTLPIYTAADTDMSFLFGLLAGLCFVPFWIGVGIHLARFVGHG